MSDDISIKIGGNTQPLDTALQKSAQRQRTIAQLTADEIDKVNRSMDRAALANFEGMSRKSTRAAEASSKPFLKLRESMDLFGGVAFRTAGVVGTAMAGIVLAARAATQALQEARAAGVESNKSGGSSALNVSAALAQSGVRNVGFVQKAASTARGSATQEQIDAFIGKFGDLAKAGVRLTDDEAVDLIKTYAQKQAVLGDGSGLLASRALLGQRPASRLADSAVAYRARTGEDLSLDAIKKQRDSVTKAEQDLATADEAVTRASRGGSVSGLQSARDRRADAAMKLNKAKAESSALWQDAQGGSGLADAALSQLGSRALREVGLRTAERDLEVSKSEMGALPEAQQERFRAVINEGRALSRDRSRLQGDNLGANVAATVAWADRAAFDDTSSARAAEQLERLVDLQTQGNQAMIETLHALQGQRTLRPEAQRE